MWTICKRFEFSSAHHLPHLPADHPCARPHGHNYVAEVVLECRDLNTWGFVCDFRELDAVKRWLDTVWDHRDLNALAEGTHRPVHTTSEALAMFLYYKVGELMPEVAPLLAEVRISETPKTWASFRPDDEVEAEVDP